MKERTITIDERKPERQFKDVKTPRDHLGYAIVKARKILGLYAYWGRALENQTGNQLFRVKDIIDGKVRVEKTRIICRDAIVYRDRHGGNPKHVKQHFSVGFAK